ncbi:MAG TPA: preprotein translocase subunit YajC [Gaiellaceae bacterium]
MSGFLIILIFVGVVWLMFVFPARKRRLQHAAMQDSVETGDDVITAGGIHGRVKAVDEDTDIVDVEIAPSVTVKLDRRAIAAVAREVEIEAEPPAEPR